MNRLIVIFSIFSAVLQAGAAWYWPFGDDDEKKLPRLSTLLEPATTLIDSASDHADDGKIDEAVADYSKALDELVRIEIENPELAAKPEFATVRNKRAYVESSIDSLLLNQALRNAKAVAITDTTDLERRYAEEKAAREAERLNAGKTGSDRGRSTAGGPALQASDKVVIEDPANRRGRMLKAREAYLKADYAAAQALLKELLDERPDDPAALNLRAMVEKSAGDVEAAEVTFSRLIESNPQSYYGYYNLAKLILETRGEAGKAIAKEYYEAGRKKCKGPEDQFLEERLK